MTRRVLSLILIAGTALASPAPSPSPRPTPKAVAKPAKRKPRVLPPIVIRGQTNEKPPTTNFFLSQTGPDTLRIDFKSRDATLDLDPAAPLVIQLNTVAGLDITPSIITREQWPKGGRSMTAHFKFTDPFRNGEIAGAASYRICRTMGTKACSQIKSRFFGCVGSRCGAPALAAKAAAKPAAKK